MGYTHLFFDLDGTLTDSEPGIVRAVSYALERLGEKTEPYEAYHRFIGPPLRDSFRDYCGFDPARTDRAIALFREYYNEKGKFENSVYPHIPDMLRELKAMGYVPVIASSKKEYFARQILEHFSLIDHFSYISCSDDVNYISKADVIRHAISELSLSADRVLMIGDRIHDIEGARECGVDVMGVLYGYGGKEEMSAADYTAESPLDICLQLGRMKKTEAGRK